MLDVAEVLAPVDPDQLDPGRDILDPVAILDIDELAGPNTPDLDRIAASIARQRRIVVGISSRAPDIAAEPLRAALALTLVPHSLDDRGLPQTCIAVDDPVDTARRLNASAAMRPLATLAFRDVLTLNTTLGIQDGLVAESQAYSMLLAGHEFRSWRDRTPRHPVPTTSNPIVVSRAGDTLSISLNRPERRNAYNTEMRDALVDALTLVALDRAITEVEISGVGPSFCSGGDLDEFGTTPDVALAHQIRLHHSAGLAMHRVADRVRVTLHGACIGAGIEIPAFSRSIAARPDAYFQLPELGMGLIPGAGGTVSITRRIGRWRTAYLGMSGHRLDAQTALAWGLVDTYV